MKWAIKNPYSRGTNCDFESVETVDEEELSDILKSLNYIWNNVMVMFEV